MSRLFVEFVDDQVMVSLDDIVAVVTGEPPTQPCRRCGSLNRRDDIKTMLRLRSGGTVHLTMPYTEVLGQLRTAVELEVAR